MKGENGVAMSRAVFITTVDNPYDPDDEWRQWLMYDSVAGHGTCCYLARIAHISDQLSDEENFEEIERAIDEIIFYNPTLYKKIVKNE